MEKDDGHETEYDDDLRRDSIFSRTIGVDRELKPKRPSYDFSRMENPSTKPTADDLKGSTF